MAITVVGKSAFASGTGGLTVGAVSGVQAGDLIRLYVESANQAISTPSGYSVVSGAQVSAGTAAAAGGMRLNVFEKWATGADASTTVADTGDHTTAIKVAYRGVDPTTPDDAAPVTGSKTTASTSSSYPGITTVTDGALVIFASALDLDSASTATTSSASNGNISSLTERHDQTVTAGAGGGIVIYDGFKATAGATGNLTATVTSTQQLYITMALRPYNPQLVTVSNSTQSNTGTQGAISQTFVGSVRVDTASLISGAVVVGDNGHGVYGSQIPSTGQNGASYLYNDLSLPADANKEIRGLITTWPSSGTLVAYENGSFTFDAADGSYSFQYQLYVDGVATGSPATVSLQVGAASSHNITVANGAQANTGSQVAIRQTHPVAGTNATTAHTGTQPAIRQTHLVGGTNATTAHTGTQGAIAQGSVTQVTVANGAQANTGAPAAIRQTHKLSGTNAATSNTGTQAAVRQTHLLAGTNTTTTHTGTQIAVRQTHLAGVANGVQANAGAQVAIRQTHKIAGTNATTAHVGTQGGVSQSATTFISGSNAAQANTGTPVAIRQTHKIAGTNGVTANTGTPAAVRQTHRLTAANAATAHTGSQGAIQHIQTVTAPGASILNTGSPISIRQTHLVGGSNAATGHVGAQIAIAQGSITQITAANSTTSHAGASPAIRQTHLLTAAPAAIDNIASTSSVVQVHLVAAVNALQTHVGTGGRAGHPASTTDLIYKLLANRQELDPVAGVFRVYEDDGVTVLMTAPAWEDADGTIPYRGQALRRIDRLEF